MLFLSFSKLFSDFLKTTLFVSFRHKCLVDQLLSQGYIALRLEKSFKKFYGRYQDLIEKYQRSVNVMVNDSFQDNFYMT